MFLPCYFYLPGLTPCTVIRFSALFLVSSDAHIVGFPLFQLADGLCQGTGLYLFCFICLKLTAGGILQLIPVNILYLFPGDRHLLPVDCPQFLQRRGLWVDLKSDRFCSRVGTFSGYGDDRCPNLFIIGVCDGVVLIPALPLENTPELPLILGLS